MWDWELSSATFAEHLDVLAAVVNDEFRAAPTLTDHSKHGAHKFVLPQHSSATALVRAVPCMAQEAALCKPQQQQANATVREELEKLSEIGDQWALVLWHVSHLFVKFGRKRGVVSVFSLWEGYFKHYLSREPYIPSGEFCESTADFCDPAGSELGMIENDKELQAKWGYGVFVCGNLLIPVREIQRIQEAVLTYVDEKPTLTPLDFLDQFAPVDFREKNRLTHGTAVVVRAADASSLSASSL
jgi:hypothetical protein